MKDYTEPTQEELFALAQEQKKLSKGNKPLEEYFNIARAMHRRIYGQMVKVEKRSKLES